MENTNSKAGDSSVTTSAARVEVTAPSLTVVAEAPDVMRVFPLSTGSIARFHKRKGQALINAQRKAGGDASQMAFALLSEVITIDGKAVLMEDLVNEDLFDLLKLQGVFGELSGEMGKATPTPLPSSN